VGLAGLFVAAFAAWLYGIRRLGRPLPERISLSDVALLGLATFKLSRLVSRAKILRFLRSPFVEPQESVDLGEIVERPQGTGWRRAIGELLTCPICSGQWIAAALTYTLVLLPGLGRTVAVLFAAAALADALHVAFDVARRGRQDTPPAPSLAPTSDAQECPTCE
jgi:hypothetical protein